MDWYLGFNIVPILIWIFKSLNLKKKKNLKEMPLTLDEIGPLFIIHFKTPTTFLVVRGI